MWQPEHIKTRHILGSAYHETVCAGWWETVLAPLGEGEVESLHTLGIDNCLSIDGLVAHYLAKAKEQA